MGLFGRFRREPSSFDTSRPEPLAIGIDGKDVQRIVDIFRTADEKRHITRSHLPDRTDYTGLVAELHMRIGAAAALEDEPQTIPLLDREFHAIEVAIRSLRCDGSMGAAGAHRAADEAEAFLNTLRVRLGHAEAVAILGNTHTIHVFRAALESSTTQQ